MFSLFISNKENFREAANLILLGCEQFNLKVEIIVIEEFISESIRSFISSDLIFFLTNDQRIGELAKAISKTGAQVINNNYLIRNRLKSYAQNQVGLAGVCVPKTFTINSNSSLKNIIKNIDFPFYLKCEQHVHNIFRIENIKMFNISIKEIDWLLGWYVEENIETPDAQFEKYYFINSKVFSRNNKEVRHNIRGILEKIADTLHLQIFSIDFIIDKNNYYIIDINPASAFFHSQDARTAFIQYIKTAQGFVPIYKLSIKKYGGLKSFILNKLRRSPGTLIKRMCRRFKKGSPVVEVGSGTGAISALLAKSGFSVTAIDYNPKMLDLIRQSFATMNVSGKIICIDAKRLKNIFPENYFDCAISHGVLEHYNNSRIYQLINDQLAISQSVVFIVPTAAMSKKYRSRGIGNERYLSTTEWRLILANKRFNIKAVYGFGSKETKYPYLPEFLWRWNITAKLLAPLAAFNEFWIEE